MHPPVDQYLLAGCGRCPLGATPDCKVHRWTKELLALRTLAQVEGVTETLKWGVPCYTVDGQNAFLIGAFNNYCAITFFKGILLADPEGRLEKPGPNSHAGRLLRFTALFQIEEQTLIIQQLIQEAIRVERAQLAIPPRTTSDPWPEELLEKMEEDPVFKSAFLALTPGRQRGYLLFFASAKQAQTRRGRIEKSEEKILNGIGLNDHYKRRNKK